MPVPTGNPDSDLIHGFLEACEPTHQTTYRLFQPFLRSSQLCKHAHRQTPAATRCIYALCGRNAAQQFHRDQLNQAAISSANQTDQNTVYSWSLVSTTHQLISNKNKLISKQHISYSKSTVNEIFSVLHLRRRVTQYRSNTYKMEHDH